MGLSRNQVAAIRQDLETAMREVGDRHGVTVSFFGLGQYAGTDATYRVRVSERPAVGDPVEAYATMLAETKLVRMPKVGHLLHAEKSVWQVLGAEKDGPVWRILTQEVGGHRLVRRSPVWVQNAARA